ncbi:MAG: hypothetical protein J1E83_10635 [Lachnospiraceae bacterium]|nr:hypothetical protein [Lachnospiraceae bacterium]
MKRKFYLRGLGIGILVTAVIMGIASGRNRQMTDEEIKARAKELGMVESTVLSNIDANNPQDSAAPSQAPENTPSVSVPPENTPSVSPTPESTPVASVSPENTPEMSTPSPSPESTPVPSPSPSPENTPAPSQAPVNTPETSTPSPSPSPENTPETSAGETVTITIRSGQSSVAVSKMLEEAGLVTSASAYDKFLCDNGYDKRLKTGTYQIPVGASEEEIARIITSKAD